MFIKEDRINDFYIQVPADIIFLKDVKEILPVYLALYMRAVPAYEDEEDIWTIATIAEITNTTGTFGVGKKRREQHNRVIKAIQYLEEGGVVHTEAFDPSKTSELFRYRFCPDMKDVFMTGNGTFSFALLGCKEYHALRKLVLAECPDGRGAETLFRVYLYFNYRRTLWQKTYINETSGTLPVWAGTLSGVATELRYHTGTMTDAVKDLHNLGLVTPCFGAILEGIGVKGKPDTMIALNLLCDEEGPVEAIWKAQDRYRKKPGKEYSRWYPAGSYRPSKKKGSDVDKQDGEGANAVKEEVMPEVRILNNDGPNIVVPEKEDKLHRISDLFHLAI